MYLVKNINFPKHLSYFKIYLHFYKNLIYKTILATVFLTNKQKEEIVKIPPFAKKLYYCGLK